MTYFELRDAIAEVGTKYSGHVTHGSLEAIIVVVDQAMVDVGNAYAKSVIRQRKGDKHYYREGYGRL